LISEFVEYKSFEKIYDSMHEGCLRAKLLFHKQKAKEQVSKDEKDVSTEFLKRRLRRK
jgi:hypothetical protein